MDIDKVFNLFSREKLIKDNIGGMDISKNSPTYKVLMFQKIMLYSKEMSEKIINILKTSPTLEKDENLDKYSNHIIYSRGYFWIGKLEEGEFEKVLLDKVNIPVLKQHLYNSIKYYEGREDFEKCIHLKKFLDFLKNI